MARRKSILKIPFIKFKINKNTFFNSIGFVIFGFAVILMMSFLQNGEVLTLINVSLVEKLGGMAFFSTFLIILFSTHFFNSKKLKIIRFNITLGLTLMFIALLGLLKSGQYGEFIFSNLELDFSVYGALLVLSLVFIIGLILFLDTSIDVFILFIFSILKKIFFVFKNYVFRSFFEKKKSSIQDKKFLSDDKEYLKEEQRIEMEDKKQQATNVSAKPQVDQKQPGEFRVTIAPKDLQYNYKLPSLDVLTESVSREADRGDTKFNAHKIETTLESFGIGAEVVDFKKGPTVSQYALKLDIGTKLSKITTLSNDLALALAAKGGQIRIEAPIPGKSLVGIEVPNIRPEIVTLKKLLSSKIFQENDSPLFVPMGLDVSGESIAASINKFPHALIAGTTGSGKSVMLNVWICSFLFRARPEELKLILVDPKRVELTVYNGIPHLLSPVIVDPKEIISALKWTVGEMESRYKIFAGHGVKSLESYNSLEGVEKKPYIVFVIDELADLMMFASNEAEGLITRIAQMARATGIHLILATQRPSVDVITGLMKANIPTRIAFNVASMMDSRVVLDSPGAEKLLGKGDMLFQPPDQPKPSRIQAPYISEKEVAQVVKMIKDQVPVVHYTEEVVNQDVSIKGMPGMSSTSSQDSSERDTLYKDILGFIFETGKVSTSLIQRKFKIGFNRAARIMEQLEADGYVGPATGTKARDVIRRSDSTSTIQTEEIV